MKFPILPLSGWKLYAAIAAIVVVVGGAYIVWGRKAASPYETVTAHAAPMQQIVSVTGKVKAKQAVDLGFSVTGRIASVDAQVSQPVMAGAVLARLDAGDLAAQLSQAQAQILSAQAKLDGLKAGAQPADIAASKAAFDKAQQDLANDHAGIADTLADAQAKANDAVYTQLNPMFSNPDSANPQLNYGSSNSQAVTDALTRRPVSGQTLTDWKQELAGLSSASAADTLEGALAHGLSRLLGVRTLIQAVGDTLSAGTNLSTATLASYKTAVTAALSEVNTVISNLNDTSQSIASQKLTVQQLQAQYDLKVAGATASDIAAQEAQVAAAQAAAQSLQAQIGKTVLRAPFAGTVTRQDAKVGAIAALNQALVSLSTEGNFEIECYVPEADIAKVTLDNPANVTLDAYGDTVPFHAKVFSMDPAETVLEGVSTYKVELSFTDSPKPVRSGMTANVDIVTATRSSAISIPARAIYEQNGKQYVKILLQDGTTEEREVTTGIQGADGSLEILSGVHEGEQVVTYTSK